MSTRSLIVVFGACLGTILLVRTVCAAGVPPGQIGYWTFDGNLDDTAGNAAGSFSGGNPVYVAGQAKQGLQFDGVDDYVDLRLPNPTAYTIVLWAKPARTDAVSIVVRTSSSGPTTHWSHQLRINPEGRFHHYLWVGSARNVSGTTLVQPDTWYHVAISAENDGPMRLYVNGEEDGDSVDVAGTLWGDGDRYYIGSNSGDSMGWFQGVVDDLQIYDRLLTQEEIRQVMSLSPESAKDPTPADAQEDVLRDVVLSWTAGEFAATHDIYLGTSFDDVNEGSGTMVSASQTATSYDPEGLLDFGQTYYWRVDEVNAPPDYTVFEGEVWSFTTEPFAYPIENIVATSNGVSEPGVGPENTVNGSGLNSDDEHSTVSEDMWLAAPGAEPLHIQYEFDRLYKLYEMLVWNYNVQFELMLGFGLKNVSVEYSADGIDWTVLGDFEFAQATAKGTYTANTVINFEGVAGKYVRLSVKDGWGPMGQFGLSEVRFLHIPAFARQPQPGNDTIEITPGTTLSWRAGREAVSHDMYLGTEPNDLALVASVDTTSYTPGDLAFGTTYYWKVDEVNEADPITIWEGNLWSFATQEFALVEGFEEYDDEDNRIYDTWLDGFVNGTGSTVGYLEAPFAEQSVVHSGIQSMPIQYDNSLAPFYSETEFDMGGMDLDTNGADTLRLFISGQAPRFYEGPDGAVLMNAIGTDIWNTSDQFRFAYKTLSGDGSLTALVEDLDESPNEWVKAGVMIRQGIGTGAQHSYMSMTGGGGNGASWQSRVHEGQASVNQDVTEAVTTPYWVRIERSGDSFFGFISPDGESWTQIGDPREVAMDDPVLIGLALTSHNANQATSAEFANISFAGNVTGNWQVSEIGVAQPEGNTPASLYVAVEDTAGSVAAVAHPDEAITARSGWTEWLISYHDLTGVNLNSVQTMYIGVGDHETPSAGGTGVVFVDDIGYGRSADLK